MDISRVEEFLYQEADLLDKAELEKWVSLFTENGTYWMPASRNQEDPHNHVSHIYDDPVMMEIRRRNFVHPRAASKEWLFSSLHIIGNVRIDERHDAQGIRVTSNQHVAVFYREEQHLYAYHGTHLLIDRGDQFLIQQKRVDLINPDAPQRSLVLYI